MKWNVIFFIYLYPSETGFVKNSTEEKHLLKKKQKEITNVLCVLTACVCFFMSILNFILKDTKLRKEIE